MSATAVPENATNGDLVRWAFEVLNGHDVSPLKPYWTAATVERFPDQTCRGPEEIAAYFEAMFAAIPDWHMEILTLVEHGDDVFVHWHLTGTHQGAIQGIEPTGRRLAVDGIDHFVLRDGLLVSNFVVFDQMQLARQIGLMPAQDSRADRTLKRAFNARSKLLRRT